MIIKQDKFAAFALAITLSGVAFFVPYMMIEWVFGMPVPRLSLGLVLLLGNICTLAFAFSLSATQRFTIRVIKKKGGAEVDE